MGEDISGDRLSSLPEVLIHHIFSFMNMREVVHTSILSNRWRYLWLSPPVLNFKLPCNPCANRNCSEYASRCYKCKDKLDKFITFVYRVLVSRQSNITMLDLSVYRTLDAKHVHAWLIGALAREAHEVTLNLLFDKPIDLPQLLFSPKNMRDLNLYMGELPFARLPKSIHRATRLTNLEQRNVVFQEEDANGELSLSFPVLKNLMIKYCNVSHLTLLENMEFSSLPKNSLPKKGNNCCKVMLCTPNLKSLLSSSGCPPWKTFFLDNLVSIVSTSITIWSPTKECAERLFKVLTGISNVQNLVMSTTRLYAPRYVVQGLKNRFWAACRDPRKWFISMPTDISGYHVTIP
ncbi:hypothetical protein ACHQM5_024914 [Ranunculus cassubicifolius]